MSSAPSHVDLLHDPVIVRHIQPLFDPGMPEMPGPHVVYLLFDKDSHDLPVVEAVLDSSGRLGYAIMAFTLRESAGLYLQVGRLDRYRVDSITAQQLAQLVKAVRRDGIDAVLADPNRRHQEDGRASGKLVRLVTLDYDPSGENIYQELFDVSGT